MKPKEFNLQGEGIAITEDGGDPRVGRVRSAQAGAWGALGGGLAGGIGGYLGKVQLGGKFQWGTEGGRALAHGVAQGGVSELRGGKFGAGFAAGFFSSFAGSRVEYARVPGYIGVPVGGVVGGLSSRIGGGSFEDGFAQGLAVNAYNHWGDDLARFGKGVWEKTKLYGGAVIDGVRSAIVDPNARGSGIVAGIEGAGLGFMAGIDGALDMIPGFEFKPFESKGLYDSSHYGLAASQAVGGVTRDSALFLYGASAWKALPILGGGHMSTRAAVGFSTLGITPFGLAFSGTGSVSLMSSFFIVNGGRVSTALELKQQIESIE